MTEGGKENNFLDGWTHDGRFIAFSSNRRDPAATDSYLLDVSTGRMRMVAENRGIGSIEDVSRDGKYAVVNRLVNRGDNNLYLVNLADGKETLLTPHEGPGEFGGAQFSTDGRTIYIASNKDRDLEAFARVRLDEAGRPGPSELRTRNSPARRSMSRGRPLRSSGTSRAEANSSSSTRRRGR